MADQLPALIPGLIPAADLAQRIAQAEHDACGADATRRTYAVAAKA